MRRAKGTAQSFKLPLSPDHLISIRNKLSLTSPLDAMFFAIVTTCFFGLLRIGNVLPTSATPGKSVIRVKDLIFHKNGAVITICSSKTIQFKERLHSAVLPLFSNHPLCPVTALKNFLAVAGLPPQDAPLFSMSNHSVLNAQAFRKRLALILASIGLPPCVYSTHSLRRGGATWLLNAGAPLHLIKVLGDWKSDTVLKYLKPNAKDSLATLNKYTNNTL